MPLYRFISNPKATLKPRGILSSLRGGLGRRIQRRFLREFNRRVDAFFRDLTGKATAQLRRTVPVRTGLMKRQVRRDERGVRYEVYSDAENRQGTQYAPYVKRYDKALKDVQEKAQRRINKKTFTLAVVVLYWKREFKFPARQLITIERDDHKLIFKLEPRLGPRLELR